MAPPRKLPITLFILIALIYPAFAGGYEVHQMSLVFSYAILMLGLNILTGFSGQISIGHTAFFAIGAYTAAILMKFGVSYELTFIPAIAVSFVSGIIFGFPVRNLGFVYLLQATLALGLAVPQLLKRFSGLTGGVQGLVITPPQVPSFLPITLDTWLYYIALAMMLLFFLLAYNLLRGHIGRAMMAIRDNPTAATAMGVNKGYYKVVTFGISAAFAGASGALVAYVVQFISPDVFNFGFAIAIFVGLIVGGVGLMAGSIYAAFFIEFVPEWTVDIYQGGPNIIFALVLISIAYFMPGGISATVRKYSNKVYDYFKEEDDEEDN